MKLSDRVTAAPDVMSRTIGDETVLLDLASGTYFGLDAVGGRMWALMSAGKSLAEVCDALVSEYDVARDVLERDVLALAEKLLAQRLVTIG